MIPRTTDVVTDIEEAVDSSLEMGDVTYASKKKFHVFHDDMDPGFDYIGSYVNREEAEIVSEKYLLDEGTSSSKITISMTLDDGSLSDVVYFVRSDYDFYLEEGKEHMYIEIECVIDEDGDVSITKEDLDG